MSSSILTVGAIRLQEAVVSHVFVFRGLPLGETPFFGDENLLTAGELELGTTQGLDNLTLVLLLSTHRHDRLPDVNPSNRSLWLTKSSTHSGLKSISTSTRQHLVDSDYVEGMESHTDMESILAAVLHKILVAANAASFQGFR